MYLYSLQIKGDSQKKNWTAHDATNLAVREVCSHTHVVTDITQRIPSGGRSWAGVDNISTEGVYSHWSKGVTASIS
jgi:hypothetical protein